MYLCQGLSISILISITVVLVLVREIHHCSYLAQRHQNKTFADSMAFP